MADILHQISTIDKETFPLVNNMNPGLFEWSKGRIYVQEQWYCVGCCEKGDVIDRGKSKY